MHLTQFPNINWLRAQANSNFSNGQGIDRISLRHKGWPNVILNTATGPAERTGIKGPFSLFLNHHGSSILRAGGSSLSIHEDVFGITNFEQYYDLIIPKGMKTTTFNIHFGEQLYFETLHSATTKPVCQLDNFGHQNYKGLNLHVRTHFRDTAFDRIILQLKELYLPGRDADVQDENENQLLSLLLLHILKLNERDLAGLQSIQSLKASTREELMRRLILSVDYIHDHYRDEVSLDSLSKVSCLSKFHFLRTFKEALGCTPGQYWRSLKLKKAESLLRQTAMTVSDIALEVGFKEVNAFIKFFRQKRKMSPTSFRRISNFG